MIAFVGPILAIVSVGAALACLFVFRMIFPRHVLKIREWQILPLAVPIIFALALPLFIWALNSVSLPKCDTVEGSFASLIILLGENPKYLWCVLGCFFLLYSVPMLFTAGVAYVLNYSWDKERYMADLARIRGKKHSRILGWDDRMTIWLSNFVTAHVLNEYSKLTAYSPSLVELMVDVRTDDGFLFSGKYSDYHWDGERCTGISMTNIMRYNDCTGGKRENDDDQDGNRIYLFPHNGKMLFTMDKIQDVHFWRIPRRFSVTRGLRTFKDAKILAWWLSIQWAIPRLKIKVTAQVDEDFNTTVGDEMIAHLTRFRLTTKQIKLLVDIQRKELEIEPSKDAKSHDSRPVN